MALQPPPESQKFWRETYELFERFRAEADEAIATRDRRIGILTAKLEAVRVELAEAERNRKDAKRVSPSIQYLFDPDVPDRFPIVEHDRLPDGAVGQEHWLRGEE